MALPQPWPGLGRRPDVRPNHWETLAGPTGPRFWHGARALRPWKSWGGLYTAGLYHLVR